MTSPPGSSRADRLRTIPLFSGLSDDALLRVADLSTDYDAPAGTVLIQPNMAGSGLFVIQEGQVQVELPKRKIELGPGEFFGELSLLTDHGHTGRVRAATDVRCLALSRTALRQLLETEPTMAISMLESLATRLVGTA